ncbi:hypothetical protein OHA72_24745 [Dactylosporangium sp. NBC_01737]|uniref:hypothetical protein n=1 Tax=Dactylosporangium sp. NBC_01737 TaxID=2975959 RepID=UPI002E150EF0|nr:hypothetical protein OHA72_24745 [Dactylosporangium sp. NBC_01737]
MSDGTQVTDLFERAVAEVPPALLLPPHAAIRRRIRRRRAAGWGAGAVAALLVVAGFVVARPGPAVEGPEPAASAVASAAPGVPWTAARIDRTGTRITVYAAPLVGKCVERDPARDDLDFSDDRVTILLDGAYTGCADDTQVAARTFELPQSVGTRFLRDARSPQGQQLVFSDADLPELSRTGGWSELPPVWLSSGAAVLALGFTRAGGPQLRIAPMRWEPEPDGRLSPPDHTLMVDGRRIDVYDRSDGPAAGWWSADERVRFTLEVTGGAIEKSAFEEILRGMTWS